MYNDKHRHPHADPFMRLLTGHLIGHKTEQENGHADIYDPFYHAVILFSLHKKLHALVFSNIFFYFSDAEVIF